MEVEQVEVEEVEEWYRSCGNCFIGRVQGKCGNAAINPAGG